jgi:predicted transcriptional regulator
MTSPLTLRVDKETRLRIARIARRKQVSASEVIRQAIEAWIEEQEPAGSPYAEFSAPQLSRTCPEMLSISRH